MKFIDYIKSQDPKLKVCVGVKNSSGWLYISTAGEFCSKINKMDKYCFDRIMEKYLKSCENTAKIPRIIKNYEKRIEINEQKLLVELDSGNKEKLKASIRKCKRCISNLNNEFPKMQVQSEKYLSILLNWKLFGERDVIETYWNDKWNATHKCVLVEGALEEDGDYWFEEEIVNKLW